MIRALLGVSVNSHRLFSEQRVVSKKQRNPLPISTVCTCCGLSDLKQTHIVDVHIPPQEHVKVVMCVMCPLPISLDPLHLPTAGNNYKTYCEAAEGAHRVRAQAHHERGHSLHCT